VVAVQFAAGSASVPSGWTPIVNALAINSTATSGASNSAMLIGGIGVNSGTPGISPPSGWTERWEAAGGQIAELADNTQLVAGVCGTATWTFSTAKAVAVWRTVLKPASWGPEPVIRFRGLPIGSDRRSWFR